MRLSTNFSLSEFACKDGTPVPGNLMENVIEVANNLQVLRDEIKLPLIIHSGYRTKSYNKMVGGKINSQHLTAKAADISCKDLTPAEIFATINALIKEGKMKQGGLGLYPTFVHYDIRGNKARW